MNLACPYAGKRPGLSFACPSPSSLSFLHRDDELVRLGLKVKDVGASVSTWMLEEKGLPSSSTPPPSNTTTTRTSSSSSEDSNKRRWAGLKKEDISAQDLFKVGPYEGQFSRYDDHGIPTHDASGKEISKSLRSKLEKKYTKHIREREREK